jgi:K+-transporting ATPase c subunit
MQSCGFSLPLTLSTLVAYVILFFVQGFTYKRDFIAIGQLFYLDKPQGKRTRDSIDQQSMNIV